MAQPLIDLLGERFGKLVVIGISEKRQSDGCRYRVCQCDCGNICEVALRLLRHRKRPTKSCGCLAVEAFIKMARRPKPPGFASGKANGRYKHGHYFLYSAERGIYGNMLARCYNSTRKEYKWYGARGISVCSRWLNGEDGRSGFDCFIADMGSRPDPTLSIDRIDNDGNYEPNNCRWATRTEQASTQRKRKAGQ